MSSNVVTRPPSLSRWSHGLSWGCFPAGCGVLSMSPGCTGINLFCLCVLGWTEGWWFDPSPWRLKAKSSSPVICFYDVLVKMESRLFGVGGFPSDAAQMITFALSLTVR